MVVVPSTRFKINEKLIAFVSEFKGEEYVNIRKTYTDKSGVECLGKGLCISREDFNDFVAVIEEVKEFVG
jgi:uncharacterized protein (DUF488 family)